MPRTRYLIAGWLVVAATFALLLTPSGAHAKSWESDEQNVILEIPEGAAAWDWLQYTSAWGKLGIVKGAKRELTKLKDGKPAEGHGALMHLAVRDAEDGMAVGSLAENDDVRAFLLKRFRGNEGDVETEEVTMGADGKFEHPAIVLRTKGKALNLKGKEAECEGILLATVARGKMVLMRLYAWPTEYDEEGLSVDINYMEGNALRLITAKEEKGKKGAPKKGPPPAEGEGEGGDGDGEDEGKEEVIEFRAQRWRMTKHPKVTREEITDDEAADFLVFKAAGNDQMGGYNFYIYAPPNTQYIDGVKAPPPNIIKWMTQDWWQNFDTNHPKGELATWKWPKKPQTKGAKTWLTVPYMEDEKNRKVVFKDGKKRPVEVSASDMIKKLKFVEKVKKNALGKKGKAGEAVRGCMEGKRPTGFPEPEVMLRFAFRNREHSYRVFVGFYGKGYLKWGEAVRATLESIEFGIKFKD